MVDYNVDILFLPIINPSNKGLSCVEEDNENSKVARFPSLTSDRLIAQEA